MDPPPTPDSRVSTWAGRRGPRCHVQGSGSVDRNTPEQACPSRPAGASRPRREQGGPSLKTRRSPLLGAALSCKDETHLVKAEVVGSQAGRSQAAGWTDIRLKARPPHQSHCFVSDARCHPGGGGRCSPLPRDPGPTPHPLWPQATTACGESPRRMQAFWYFLPPDSPLTVEVGSCLSDEHRRPRSAICGLIVRMFAGGNQESG